MGPRTRQLDKHHVGLLGQCLGIQFEASSDIISSVMEHTPDMYLVKGPWNIKISLICATFETMELELGEVKTDAETRIPNSLEPHYN